MILIIPSLFIFSVLTVFNCVNSFKYFHLTFYFFQQSYNNVGMFYCIVKRRNEGGQRLVQLYSYLWNWGLSYFNVKQCHTSWVEVVLLRIITDKNVKGGGIRIKSQHTMSKKYIIDFLQTICSNKHHSHFSTSKPSINMQHLHYDCK